jgi:hypothetical protein
MTKEDLIKHGTRILVNSQTNPVGAKAEAEQFLETYVGSKNSFLKSLRDTPLSFGKGTVQHVVQSTMSSFIEHVKNDLLKTITIHREIQIDTVSDYLSQAETLLNDNNVHPAAPAVIIGASLEEFLRCWLEDQDVDLSKIKLSLDSYSNELRVRNLITKQDVKDILSWAGIRNDAAHGHWDNVKEKARIRLMLEGVNLFMRKYSMR